MIATYHGELFIKLQAGDTTISINPIGKESGRKTTKFGSDICMVSANLPTMNGTEFASNATKTPVVLSGPGEYEVGGILIKAIQTSFKKKIKGEEVSKMNTVYAFTFDNIKVCVLGVLQERLDSDTKDQLGDVDICFVPVLEDKDFPYLNPKDAVYVANSINAKIVIPVGYDDKTLPIFLKESGAVGTISIEKLTIKKKDLEGKEGSVVTLQEI